jgi:ribosome-associated protein
VGTNRIRTSETEFHLPKPAKRSFQIDSRQAAFIAANTAEAKKGRGTLILDVGQVTVLADYFVITGAESLTQVRAISDGIEEALEQLGLTPRSIEGKKEGRWVLMDYEQIIVHVLHEKDRNYYKLEQFWNHALIIDRNVWLADDPGKLQTVSKPTRRGTRKAFE